jgi:UDP-3-O-[3-hydroxymyristoyl] glucosamine N-acyltransferase
VPEVSLADIAAHLGGELFGDPALRISRIASLESADERSIAFLSNPRYQAQLGSTRAACVIVSPALKDAAAARGAALVAADPYLSFARLTQWWAALERGRPVPGVHASAIVEAGAHVDASAAVGPFAVVAAGAHLDSGVQVGAHCVVGPGVTLGRGSRLSARVTLERGTHLGERCIVHSGVVIGADGFGFAPTEGRWEKIEQLGGVRIGNDVEIGANTCIDRGALEDTVIEDGVKLDNLIQIGHNVRIGAHTAMAGCVGVAGSAKIGARCTIGGSAGILGHLTIADDVHISSFSLVTRSIAKAGHYTGVFPLDDNAAWEKNAATLRQLHTLRERVRALEKKTP